jgi:large subunit ribosomal protein L1
MRKRSKRYQQSVTTVERRKTYEIDEGIRVLKGFTSPKFDETVEIAMKLGIDPKKSDQMIRGAYSLPKGIGKERRVIVFADGDQADAAREAGAIEVGSEDLVAKIAGGWSDFDVAISVPRLMRFVGKLGKVLGPQGKMPSPKSGTVTDDVASAVGEFRAGKVEYRADSGANIHAPVGKKSFPEDDLRENITAFVDHIRSVKPAAAKGTYIHKVVISTSMNPGVAIAFS